MDRDTRHRQRQFRYEKSNFSMVLDSLDRELTIRKAGILIAPRRNKSISSTTCCWIVPLNLP
jgi:hypothetical protein